MTYEVNSDSPLPLYYQVYSSLKERIESGEFQPDEALPPERQLVQDYGVSRITIVKALDLLENNDSLIRREHGRGTFVNEQLTSDPDDIPVIAFISGVMMHPYIYSVLMGVARAAAEQQYRLHMIGLHSEEMDDEFAMNQATSKNVAGVVIYPRSGNQDYMLCKKIMDRGIPLVMVDRYYDELENDYVVFDEQVASYQLTRHLLEQGHQKIALLTHHEVEASSVHNRIRGYRQALEEESLYQDNLLWFDIYADLHISKGQIGNEKMTRMLRERLENSEVTAVLAINHDVAERLNYDLMLINAERAREGMDASTNGHNSYELNVDIAAFGYRNLADFSMYNIVTALQVGEDLGKHAIQILRRRFDNTVDDDTSSHVRVSLPIIFPDAPGLDERSKRPFIDESNEL